MIIIASCLQADLALQDQIGDLSGFYVCKGKEANGKAYSGLATIARKGEVYVVSWLLHGGGHVQGLGVRQGDVLAIAWSAPGPGGTLAQGCNVYRIGPCEGKGESCGPKLVGRWAAVPGNGQLQSETLTFLKAADAEE